MEKWLLEVYVPRYTNQAINFTGEDMGGDCRHNGGNTALYYNRDHGIYLCDYDSTIRS